MSRGYPISSHKHSHRFLSTLYMLFYFSQAPFSVGPISAVSTAVSLRSEASFASLPHLSEPAPFVGLERPVTTPTDSAFAYFVSLQTYSNPTTLRLDQQHATS